MGNAGQGLSNFQSPQQWSCLSLTKSFLTMETVEWRQRFWAVGVGEVRQKEGSAVCTGVLEAWGGGGRSVPRVPCQARPGFLPVLSAVPARVLHTWCSLSQSPCHCFCFAQRYDRTKLSLKEITNVQYVSCMNPTAGSFTINPRLQVKPCAMAGTSLVLFLCGIFKHEARRKH